MLPELKTFMSIVEVNNIDKVMENLNISKATIYEHIKYLEQYFSSNIARISEKNEIGMEINKDNWKQIDLNVDSLWLIPERAVSYTHLDVYKRQASVRRSILARRRFRQRNQPLRRLSPPQGPRKG